MNKIDLEAIAMKYIKARPHHTKLMIARAVAIEVAHQALVLASEKATTHRIDVGYHEYETEVDKQSILDVEKLIV